MIVQLLLGVRTKVIFVGIVMSSLGILVASDETACFILAVLLLETLAEQRKQSYVELAGARAHLCCQFASFLISQLLLFFLLLLPLLFQHVLQSGLILLATMVHLIAARFGQEFASDLFLGFALAIRFKRANHDNLKRLFSLFTRVFGP